MSVSIDATYENGVFVPTQQPPLKDHTRVRLQVEIRGSVAEKTAGLVEFDGTLTEYLEIARMSEEDPAQE
jgi:predicted DNA-binding antitoxin AbrB/MazE fold protein